MILNTNRIHKSFRRNSPKELNKCLQKFYLSARKRDGRSVMRAKIVIVGNRKWVKNLHFLLNYLTALVYTKTIIHLSVIG